MKKLSWKKCATTLLLCVLSISIISTPVYATIDYMAEAEARKSMSIQSNAIPNWPAGPEIGAKSAILLEANTGSILYEKNVHEKLYPASITKLLTAYIAMKKSNMNDMVTFSSEAVHSINWREDANMGIDVGSSITMEQTLYGVLVGSANEAAYAVAEHISGSIEEFAKLMNETAKELGAKNSNFVTPNGIHDENHYTTAYDMAMIAKGFFANELLSKMSGTSAYQVPTTATQPKENMIVSAKSQLFPKKKYAYEYLVGTKTGYTTEARQTLVSCAEHNGMKLICVIMCEESPFQFEDTVELFNYGFNNFSAVNIQDQDTPYSVEDNHFFQIGNDFFGNSKPILALNEEDYIVIPNTISFADVTDRLSYDHLGENEVARVEYYYNNTFVGYAAVELAVEEPVSFDFGKEVPLEEEEEIQTETKVVFINIKHVIIGILAAVAVLSFLFFLQSMGRNNKKARRRNNRLTRKKSRESFFHLDELDL